MKYMFVVYGPKKGCEFDEGTALRACVTHQLVLVFQSNYDLSQSMYTCSVLSCYCLLSLCLIKYNRQHNLCFVAVEIYWWPPNWVFDCHYLKSSPNYPQWACWEIWLWCCGSFCWAWHWNGVSLWTTYTSSP